MSKKQKPMPMYRRIPQTVEAREVPEVDEFGNGALDLEALAEWCGGEVVKDAVRGPVIIVGANHGDVVAE